jgi:hypothetical protein
MGKLTGHPGLILDTMVLFDFARRQVTELAMQSLLVEPGHPPTRGDLEVVEPSPVPAVVGEGGGVAVQLGLEDSHH